MKILFAIAEAFPLVKVGGLADVGGALPRALSRRGHVVHVVLPDHPDLDRGRSVATLAVPMGPLTEQVEVERLATGPDVGLDGAEVLVVRHPDLRAAGAAYGGHGYQDEDVVPYVLFARAVAALAAHPSWRPDVVHCHDWHAALAPREVRSPALAGACAGVGTVLTIHNLAYQGRFGPEAEMLVPAGDDEPDNLLAVGITSADVVNTVSAGYLEEIVSPKYGMGLDRLLRERRDRLHGVLNGVDYDSFDPRRDPHLPVPYDVSPEVAKRANKRALQLRSGLPVDPDVPVLGMVARLVDQKGLGLLCEAVDGLVGLGAQLVVMGTGDERWAEALEAAAERHAGVAYHRTSEESLARLVYAGSDVFLSPSSFEPCGLAPLVALRYGTVPVVRRTGGLRETVVDYDEDPARGLGFAFSTRSPERFVAAVARSLAVRSRPPEWRALLARAMTADFSWDEPVRRYEQLYAQAVSARAGVPAHVDGAGGAHPAVGRDRAARRATPTRRAPLALVHHANQFLVTDGYEDRQGITQIVEGYTALLHLHERYGVPAALHLSGTLLETAAWHAPGFLALVRRLVAAGLVSLVGGTYAENVMVLFPSEHNRRQLEEHLWLLQHHLGADPTTLRTCWVPERVWDTAALAPVIADPRLPNGGYRHVVLDDRLLHPAAVTGPGRSPRARFDDEGPGSARGVATHAEHEVDSSRAYRVVGGSGLVVAPISVGLRYSLPPASPEQWRQLADAVEACARCEGRVLVYADDLERTAGVGGWDPSALRRYEGLLRWLAWHDEVEVVHLDRWLEDHPPSQEREVQPGTFVELARDWAAGEDYRGWWMDPAWAPFRTHLEATQGALGAVAPQGADPALLELAWKHVLACSYETAWQDPAPSGGTAPAAWAEALASHSRAARLVLDAARWLGE